MQTLSRAELPLTATSSLGCSYCSTERALANVDGVESAKIGLVPGGVSRLLVTGPTGLETITSALTAAGYGITNR